MAKYIIITAIIALIATIIFEFFGTEIRQIVSGSMAKLNISPSFMAVTTNAPWEQGKAGSEALGPDYLPAEFSPLSLSGTTVAADGKQAFFNSIGLEDKISIRGRELLGGATLSLVVDGKPVVLKQSSQKFKSAGNGCVLGITRLSGGPVDAEIGVEVEFDFVAWHTLTLNPKAGCSLDGLTISYSLDASVGELCAYNDEPPTKALSGVEGERLRIFRCLRPDENVIRGFCPEFWAGDTRGGISWNFSSPRNWSSGEGALVLDRPAKQFRLSFVRSPRRLEQPMTFSWSLIPTPVKAMPPNWRTWRFEARTIETSHPPEYPTNISTKVIYWNSLWLISGDMYNNNWVRDDKMLRTVIARDHAKGFALLPYFIPSLITYAEISVKDGQTNCLEDTALRDVVLRYRSEPAYCPIRKVPTNAVYFNSLAERNSFWANVRLTNAVSGNAMVTTGPEINDWLARTAQNMLTNFDMDGMYVDGMNVGPDFRITSERPYGGFIDENGKNRPTYAHRERRDLYKRWRFILKQHRPDGVMIGHVSGGRPCIQMGLYDVLLIGENFFYWYHEPEKRDASPNGDYYYAHIYGDIDRLKTEFFWRQWGMPTLVLPEVRGRDRKIFPNPTRGTRTMLAYLLHFDLLIWPNWSDVREIRRWWKIQDSYGMADEGSTVVEFVPYWENTRITAGDANVKISYYQKIKEKNSNAASSPQQKDLLVIVSNLQFKNSQIVLTLPADLAGCEVLDMSSNKKLALEPGNKITFALDQYDFSVLRIMMPPVKSRL